LALLTRGVEAGRVPLDSFVRHEGWKVWRPLTDFTDYIEEGVAPLPQFPLPGESDGRRDDEMVDLLGVESVRQPRSAPTRASLVEFASAEGVPSRSSSEGEGDPMRAEAADEVAPKPAASVIPPPGESWPEGESDPEAESLEALEDEVLESPTDVTDELAGRETELSALLEGARDHARFDHAANALEERVRLLEPLEPAATDDIPASVDGEEGWGNARPADSADALPEDDLEGADDLSDALLLLLGGLVKRTRADVALLYRSHDTGAKVVCTHGPGTTAALGWVVTLLDPAFVAAAAGHFVVGEPHPGPIGRATMTRLQKLGIDVVSTMLLPISVNGRLFGFVELGKSVKQAPSTFSPREVVKAEDLALAFAKHIGDGEFEI
jgi:hypothetical protein